MKEKIFLKSRRFWLRTVLGIVLVFLLFLLYELKVYGGIYLSSEIREGIRLADQMELKGKDFYHVKEGYYCGEGGIDCDHGEGYIYFEEDLDEIEAMERAGFKHTDQYSDDGKMEFYRGDHADVMKVIKYKEGSLLWYRITGAA